MSTPDIPLQSPAGKHSEEELTRHKEYYFADGSVTFLVERTLFKVHKYLFRMSPIFCKMFAHGSVTCGAVGTEDHPIPLADVTLAGFADLCRYIYTPKLDFEAKFTASFEEWIVIFDLATRLNFFSISLAALRAIEGTNGRTVEKILIAKKANQERWLFKLYKELCCQACFISEEEGEMLGVKDIVLLAKAREEYSRGAANSSTPGSPDHIIAKYFHVKREGTPPMSLSERVAFFLYDDVLRSASLRDVCNAATWPELMDSEPLEDGPSIKSNTAMDKLHPKYYFEDGSLIFLVDNVLFRVHRYLFEGSVVFRDMFALPQGNRNPEGLSNEYPIRLSDVKATEFACLCGFMYRPSLYGKFNGPFEEWKAIFYLSAKFMFDNIHSIAKRELQKFDGHQLEKIIIAKEHDLQDWLPPLYAWLCQRPEFVSEEEAKILGLSTVVTLARIREKRVERSRYSEISAEDIVQEISALSLLQDSDR